MSYSLIVATCKNNGIGINNKMPWEKIDEDMKMFTKLTKGNGNNSVIMGKNTFLSIGRLLPNRFNIIISKTLDKNNYKDLDDSKFEIFDSIEKCIKYCNDKNFDENFIIGGEKIYKQFLKLDIIEYIYETKIYEEYECDTFFPEVPVKFTFSFIKKIKSNPTCIFLKWSSKRF